MLKSICNYNLIREISSGGMATVYLGINTQNNEKVAVKILHERLLLKEKIYERFKQEGFFKLDHPNIVKILDAGIHESSPYIVMEYIEGQNLEEYIRQKGKLDISTALNIFIQLLNALSYVHSKGIIHRDIKPKNILIDKSGTAKLTDFGIAKSLYSHIKTSTGGYLGAPAYSSPEQMDGKDIDAKSDIYSLGITLYEMLAGHIPYSSSSIDVIINEKFLSKYILITKHVHNTPSYIVSIINRCIAKKSNDRFSSAGEILVLLNKYRNSETVIKASAKTPSRSTNKLGISFVIVVPILVIIIIIMSLMLVTARSGNRGGAKTTVAVIDTTETTTKASIATKDVYSIGDNGPAGGFIFYINPNYKADGWHYLEAAPVDQSVGIQWYNGSYIIMPVKATHVGIGRTNTQIIIKAQGEGNYAAQLCNDLTLGGNSDWFLPSKDELNLMYENLKKKGLCGFAPDLYWSSSKSNIYDTWLQYFEDGGQGYYNSKYSYIRVRAVRSF